MPVKITVGNILRKKKLTIAVAESCTGGLISSRITDVSGSSSYFKLGIIAYSNRIKESILGVSNISIQKFGAVSKEVALEMANGARRIGKTNVGIGVTGIAGPWGGTKLKPLGLVYIALVKDKKKIVREFHFKGSRKSIKSQASQAAFKIICGHS